MLTEDSREPLHWAEAHDLSSARSKFAHAASRFIDAAGCELHVIDEAGPLSRPALVLLSSQWLNARSFWRFAAALEQRYRLVRVDLPGQGLTGPAPRDDHSAPAYAALIADLLVKLELTSYVLIGTSFSAIAAALHAAARPVGLKGLVLATASGLPRGAHDPQPNTPPSDERLMQTREGRRPIEFYKWKLRTLLARPMAGSEFATHVHEAAVMNDLPGRASEVESRIRLHDRELLTRKLPLIDVPCLVQWSSQSTYLPPVMAHDVAQRLADCAAVQIYPITGHLLLLDAPEETARDINRFVHGLA